MKTQSIPIYMGDKKDEYNILIEYFSGISTIFISIVDTFKIKHYERRYTQGEDYTTLDNIELESLIGKTLREYTLIPF